VAGQLQAQYLAMTSTFGRKIDIKLLILECLFFSVDGARGSRGIRISDLLGGVRQWHFAVLRSSCWS
jgi:hypothetical protein